MLGPGVGLSTLQPWFPEVARDELREIVRRYRAAFRRSHGALLHRLRWREPGTVWAADFSQAPAPIDGRWKHLLAVRDLAAHYQLAAEPAMRQDAAHASEVLETLAHVHGAPLVLKIDNGSALISGELRSWADRSQVCLLFSPPRTPSYNGSIEAGIGSIKSRADVQAARAGRPGEWSLEDVAAAVLQANETARPWGAHGPTPAEVWAARTPVTDEQRASFRSVYRKEYALECGRRDVPWGIDLPRRIRASIDRQAVPRALTERGYLEFRRRRIPPPILRRIADRIP